MKLLMRVVLGSALGSFACYPAAAQGIRPAPRLAPTAAQVGPSDAAVQARADALTTSMTQPLGLTPAQVEKVRVINLNSVRNVEAARLRYRQDPTKLRGYIDDIGLARLEQLKDVLNSSQFQRYQQKREEKMGIPSTRGSQGTPPPGLGNE